MLITINNSDPPQSNPHGAFLLYVKCTIPYKPKEVSESFGDFFFILLCSYSFCLSCSVPDDLFLHRSGGKTSADGKESAMITDGSEKDTIMDEQLKKECTWHGKTADYKLVFHTKGGEEFIFCLYGNVLYDAKNDCGVALTDTQLSELKTQMGH